ncbi:hypothetical protein EG68_03921 [Paragonimus skrjabini miyazakii]|uniref:RIIa domain-containing protein n=1 Tax=Paragonimus skrjabini miyazakii TaxID=59628 RepID=A0A8S9YUD1_9TREM|nr:hypothetical protein EG68_03921 [Paragonimus skrjabini miyazakii]
MSIVDTGSAPPNHDPPISMEPYDLAKSGDLGALNNHQQAATNKLKTETRLNNELYLRRHPEIRYMISAFLRDLLLKKPEDARKHFTDFFTHPDLLKRMDEQKEEYQRQHEDDVTARMLADEDFDEDE